LFGVMQRLVSVPEAWQAIDANCGPLEPYPYPLLEAVGLVLAESLRADLDLPPFDKAAVDGLAVKRSDAVPGRQLEVIEEVIAGSEPQRKVSPGKAIRVMTGAPVPEGTDVVIMVEHTKTHSGRRVEITGLPGKGSGILGRGEELRAGTEVLASETLIEPRHVAVLAAQGHLRLLCHRRPRVAILATGNEVVPANRRPKGAEIRNANNLMLVSLVGSENALGHDLGICPDEEVSLGLAIRRALTSDIVLVSGGVSAGVRDLVPRILVEEGVAPVFHHVAVKPGHPLWFGMADHKPVFGLPGNPVSVFVCFELFVRPALRRLLGLRPGLVEPEVGEWFGPTLSAHDKLRAVGVSLHHDGGTLRLCPIPSRGSSDVKALSQYEALALLLPEMEINPGACLEAIRVGQEAIGLREKLKV
jgi:molybdopterin molybdotransferase